MDSPLRSCKRRSLTVVRYLVEKCAADPDKPTNTGFRPLYRAAQQGRLSVVEYFVEKCKVDINQDDNNATGTALSIAAENGHLDVVNCLLDRGALVDKGQRNTEKSPLWFACAGGHFDIAKELISRGAKIDCASSLDWTPLHIAASKSFISIMELLLSKGANIEAWTEKRKSREEVDGGYTPFLLACTYYQPEAVDFLLKRGADPLAVVIKYGWSALTIAVLEEDELTKKDPTVIQRSERVIDILLTRTKIDPNYMPNDTRNMSTAFRFAVLRGYINLVKRLLKDKRVDVNQDFYFGHFALYLAAEAGHEDIVTLLLADPRINTSQKNYKSETALHIAEQKGHTKIVTLLRAASIDTDPPLCRAARKGDIAEMMRLVKTDRRCLKETTDSGETPLYIACNANQLEAVQFLVRQKEIDPCAITPRGYFPLYIAAEKGSADIILALLTNERTDVNQVNLQSGEQTCLYTAAMYGKTDAVRALLTSPKINVNQANRSNGWDGWGPINQAASQGHVEVVRLLLGHKDIDPNIRSAEWTGYNSALTSAAKDSRMEIVVVLLDHPRTDVNIQTREGYTALMSAAGNGDSAMVEKLLSQPVIKIDLMHKDGHAAIHFAAMANHSKGLSILLAKDRNQLNLVDKSNCTPLMLAAQKGHLESVKVLVEAGADLTAVSKDSFTARQLAAKNGHVKVATYLKELEDKIALQKAEKQQKVLQSQIQQETEKEERLQTQLSQTINLKDHQDEVLRLRQELEKLQAAVKPLVDRYERKQQVLQEQTYLRSQPLLKAFYQHFQIKMTELFLAYKVINSGMVDRTATTSDTVADQATSFISLLGGLIPLPGASYVASAINLGIQIGQKVLQKKEENRIDLISKLIINLSEMEKQVEIAARLLSFKFERQIQALKEESATTLAECAVGRLIEYLRAGKANDVEPLSDQLMIAIVEFNANQGKIPFTNKTIETQEKKSEKWHDKGIFQETGVVTAEGKKFIGEKCHVDVYGFRNGTMEEAVRLKYALKGIDQTLVHSPLMASTSSAIPSPAVIAPTTPRPAATAVHSSTPPVVHTKSESALELENQRLKQQLAEMQHNSQQAHPKAWDEVAKEVVQKAVIQFSNGAKIKHGKLSADHEAALEKLLTAKFVGAKLKISAKRLGVLQEKLVDSLKMFFHKKTSLGFHSANITMQMSHDHVAKDELLNHVIMQVLTEFTSTQSRHTSTTSATHS